MATQLNPDFTPQLQTTVETVTPAMACDYMKMNAMNRPLAPQTVARYARDMKQASWRLDGATIKFDSFGRLIDGQHRLTACIEAQTPFVSLVVRGLPPSAFETQDQNRLRSGSQVLALKGVANPSYIEKAAIVVWQHEAGLLGKSSRVAEPTLPELLDTVSRHPALPDHVAFISSLGFRMRKFPGAWFGLHFLFSQAGGRERADRFFIDLAHGENLVANDATYVLREAVVVRGGRVTAGGGIVKYTGRELLAMTIKAWNAHVKGRPVTRLKFTQRGTHAEAFPTITRVV